MIIRLIRHAETPGNALLRYIGRTDESISERGAALAKATAVDCSPERVYVSTLCRTAQTAAILFPRAHQTANAGLSEMDFGEFEGLSFADMEHSAAYRSWVDSGCTAPCPGGESRGEFSERVCVAFARIFREETEKGTEELTFIVHGGTIMAVMARFALPGADYFSYSVKNCRGYVCSAEADGEGLPRLSVLKGWGEDA